MKELYLDYAAATPLNPKVLKKMLPYFNETFANPNARHSAGLKAKQALDQSRKSIAGILNCKSSEIIFCGTGTESNNLAIFGSARANKKHGRHLITGQIEHSSVLNSFKELEKEGFAVTYLPVDREGFINPDDLAKAIRPDTILASIIYANNEIGTIQPLAEIGKICRKNKVIFHSDACQAAAHLTLDTALLHTDLLSLSATKIYGPKSAALLYIKEGIKIQPISAGGGQEKGLRHGTQNVPGIVGFAEALKLCREGRAEESQRLRNLQKHFLKNLAAKIPAATLNGPPPSAKRLPNNLNIAFPGIENKELLLQLDHYNIYVSTGSACSSQKEEISHVLAAIKLPNDLAQSSIRISLGKSTNVADLDYLIEKLLIILNREKNG